MSMPLFLSEWLIHMPRHNTTPCHIEIVIFGFFFFFLVGILFYFCVWYSFPVITKYMKFTYTFSKQNCCHIALGTAYRGQVPQPDPIVCRIFKYRSTPILKCILNNYFIQNDKRKIPKLEFCWKERFFPNLVH